MKTINIFLMVVLFLSLSMGAQETEPQEEPIPTVEPPAASETPSPELADLNIDIGNIQVPRPFIQAKKNYEPGTYPVKLTLKEGVPYFNFYSQQQELLFEEMAMVKPTKTKPASKKSTYRVKKGFINNYEYFKIEVITAGHRFTAFLLVNEPKKEEVKTEVKENEAGEEDTHPSSFNPRPGF